MIYNVETKVTKDASNDIIEFKYADIIRRKYANIMAYILTTHKNKKITFEFLATDNLEEEVLTLSLNMEHETALRDDFKDL